MCRRHLKELFSKFRSSSASDRTSRLDPASSSSEACHQKSQWLGVQAGSGSTRQEQMRFASATLTTPNTTISTSL